MMTSADARRRWWGLFYLVMAFGLLTWGETLLKPYLEGYGYVAYWLICFLFTLLAIFTSLKDFAVMRLRSRHANELLVENTLKEVERLRKEHDLEPGPSNTDRERAAENPSSATD